MLGYGFWQREFGGERSVLGQTLLVNGAPVVIVGVLPRGACGVDPSWCPDLSLPMVMQPLVGRRRRASSTSRGAGASR